MGSSKYKLTRHKKNGVNAYPKTLVEAVFWDREKKPLEEVLDGLESVAEEVPGKIDAPAAAGSAGQVLSLDANGKSAWVDAATGGTYDGALSDSSTNAPQNKVVTAKLSELGQKVDDLENKTESVSGEHIMGSEELITILDSTDTEIVKITPEYSNFKKLCADGVPVKPIEESIAPTTEEAVIIESNGEELARFDKEKLISLNNTRKKINILSNDTEFDILDKFILADSQGNTDVIFERSTYTLSAIYLYMRDTLGWTGNRFGLPIGHNNRYFFNGSTIISNNPAGFTNVRDALVTRTINGDFELYDGIIINNAGQYCIHDEGGGYSTSYSHYYKNMVLKYDGTTGQPFGCGTGFDANLRFEECIFETTWTGATTFSIHGPISNPNNDPVSVDLRIDGCYFNSLNISINQTYFDGARDNLFLRIANCRMFGAVSDTNFEILSFNNTIS